MNVACAKCGAPISPEQAFCPKCGAVQGATQERREDIDFDMAATMLGQKFPAPPPAPKPPANPHARTPLAAPQPTQGNAPQSRTPQVNAPEHRRAPAPVVPVASASGNRAIYLILGLFVVLVIGGLLAFFVYIVFKGS